MNLAAMTLVGETGLVSVQPSVPRSRSVDTSAIVARIAIDRDRLAGPAEQDVGGRVVREEARGLRLPWSPRR